MAKPQYAILRFAKYKGPGIHDIEAHNERTKEKYASNPDIDPERTHLNFHLVEPADRYRKESKRQIEEAGCRTRKDSVRVVEALFTVSPEFFKGKKRADVKAFYEYALEFMKQEQNPKTYISAVVHMDEKTPHMHLCFVPLTADNRLSAKEIVGNKKKLSVWQDKFWAHMVQKYPTLERGESASESGRKHIPVRVFKQMTRLTKQKERLDKLLGDVKLTNYKERTQQIIEFLDKYIPDIEQMDTELQKYRATFESADAEIKALEESNESMAEKLKKLQTESAIKKLKDNQLRQDYEDARAILDRIPPEILRQYRSRANNQKQEIHR